MARHLFGGTAADVAEAIDGSRVAGATGTVWDGSGDTATQLTDLTDLAGLPLQYLLSDDQGMVDEFYGPDGVTILYVDFGSGRVVLTPTDTAGILDNHLVANDPHGAKAGALAELNAEKGAANGLATLDSTGKVPSSQLPSSVSSANVVDWYSVKALSYGAKGDGTTDDTAAIQAAVTAAATAGGGTVYLPAGRYILSGSLNWSTGVNLVGAGTRVSILQQTSSTADTITGQDISDVRIEAVQLSGPGRGSGSGVQFSRLSSPANSGITLRDVFIQSMGGDGVFLHELASSVLDRVRVRTCGAVGFHLQAPQDTILGGASTSLTACSAEGCVQGGYWLDGMSYTSLKGCAAQQSPNGFRLDTCTGVNLSSCGAEQCTTGLVIYGGKGSGTNSFVTKASDGTSVWVTSAAVGVVLSGVTEISPGTGGATCLKTDAGTTTTVLGLTAVKANSLSGTVHQLDS